MTQNTDQKAPEQEIPAKKNADKKTALKNTSQKKTTTKKATSKKTAAKKAMPATGSIESHVNLDAKATQSRFAEMVGCSQQAIQKHVGRVLPRGGTYRIWLHKYIEQLRSEAAGRGGDDQATLTRARIESENMKTSLGRIAYQEKLRALVPVNEVETVLIDWADMANREYQNGIDKLVHEVESKHSIQIDEPMVINIAGPTIKRIADYATKLAAAITGSAAGI